MKNLELCFQIVAVCVPIMIILLIFIILLKRKDAKITLKKASIGGVELEISKKDVENISIISSPIAACRNELLTPPLKVKLLDENEQILRQRKVKLEVYGENGIVSVRKLSGTLTKYSDNDGIVTFDDLTIDATGIFTIYVICEKQQVEIDDIDIFPLGLSIDFWNFPVGSQEYEEMLDRILRFKTNERGISLKQISRVQPKNKGHSKQTA